MNHAALEALRNDARDGQCLDLGVTVMRLIDAILAPEAPPPLWLTEAVTRWMALGPDRSPADLASAAYELGRADATTLARLEIENTHAAWDAEVKGLRTDLDGRDLAIGRLRTALDEERRCYEALLARVRSALEGGDRG